MVDPTGGLRCTSPFLPGKPNIIPVFSKQTIREYQQAGVPNMELSLYNLENDPHLSPFSRDDVFQTIFERLLNLKF